MFTGIIEEMGVIRSLQKEGSNIHFTIEAAFTPELKIDQSVAHDGVCLTVVEISGNQYRVTAIDETLQKTSLSQLREGDYINLERCMPANGRFDGHIVQGHVDQIAECISIDDLNGSWKFGFKHVPQADNITVKKGSITINGVSLTVVDSSEGFFSVAIIPYTYHHTNFRYLKPGSVVNIEFDIIGKYVARLLGRG